MNFTNRKNIQGKENRKYTIQDYKRVISLRKRGISYNKLAKLVNISCTTVQYWIKSKRKPRMIYATQKQQRQMTKSSKKLTQDLAYIYGVLIGDGFLENYSQRICLQVTDKEFALRFFKTMERWSGFKPTYAKSIRVHNRRTKYGNLINATSHYHTVRLGSKQIFQFLKTKIKCKTKDWCVPDEIKKSKDIKIISAFLQGLFDSEGFPIYDKKNKTRRIEIEMWGKQLNQIQSLLLKLGIESKVSEGKRGMGRGTFILRIFGKINISLFAKYINFTIKRKRKKLFDLLKSY